MYAPVQSSYTNGFKVVFKPRETGEYRGRIWVHGDQMEVGESRFSGDNRELKV